MAAVIGRSVDSFLVDIKATKKVKAKKIKLAWLA